MKNDFIKNKNTYNQPKKAVKRTFSFYALVFALLFMFIGSILGSIAFVRTCDTDNSVNTAYADEIVESYEYLGSDTLFPVNVYRRFYNNEPYPFGTITSNLPEVASLGFNFARRYSYNVAGGYYVSNVPTLKFDWMGLLRSESFNIHGSVYKTYILSGDTANLTTSYISNSTFGVFYGGYSATNLTENLPNQTFYNDSTVITATYTIGYENTNRTNEYFFGKIITTTTYGFNCNITKAEIYSSVPQLSTSGTIEYQSFSNFVKYYDSNGRTFLIEIPCRVRYTADLSNVQHFPVVGNYKLEPRTYYFGGVGGADVKKALQEQAEALNSRFEDEKQALEIQYNNRLENAKAESFEAGRIAGMNSSEEANFLTLFGALFDAPIQAISGLLNFEVLGFNLWSFITALISVSLVIFVVRFFL